MKYKRPNIHNVQQLWDATTGSQETINAPSVANTRGILRWNRSYSNEDRTHSQLACLLETLILASHEREGKGVHHRSEIKEKLSFDPFLTTSGKCELYLARTFPGTIVLGLVCMHRNYGRKLCIIHEVQIRGLSPHSYNVKWITKNIQSCLNSQMCKLIPKNGTQCKMRNIYHHKIRQKLNCLKNRLSNNKITTYKRHFTQMCITIPITLQKRALVDEVKANVENTFPLSLKYKDQNTNSILDPMKDCKNPKRTRYKEPNKIRNNNVIIVCEENDLDSDEIASLKLNLKRMNAFAVLDIHEGIVDGKSEVADFVDFLTKSYKPVTVIVYLTSAMSTHVMWHINTVISSCLYGQIPITLLTYAQPRLGRLNIPNCLLPFPILTKQMQIDNDKLTLLPENKHILVHPRNAMHNVNYEKFDKVGKIQERYNTCCSSTFIYSLQADKIPCRKRDMRAFISQIHLRHNLANKQIHFITDFDDDIFDVTRGLLKTFPDIDTTINDDGIPAGKLLYIEYAAELSKDKLFIIALSGAPLNQDLIYACDLLFGINGRNYQDYLQENPDLNSEWVLPPPESVR
ncbi:uncharacterized protein LOC124152233 [Haliotis rufescens]|uniref:uncharacterized protein LOC124152233 n=1 Tax=Haliotis rufescens TaxID=6454 RepID=UPI00201FA319|nr:uncharacterized protein LOC124152233 [Haliotis rufescens]